MIGSTINSTVMLDIRDENTMPPCINVQNAPMSGKLNLDSVESQPEKMCKGLKRSIQEAERGEADEYAEQVEDGVVTQLTVTKRARIGALLKEASSRLRAGRAVLTASALAGLERGRAARSKYVQPWMTRLGGGVAVFPQHVSMHPLAQPGAPIFGEVTMTSAESEPEKTRKGVKRSIQEVVGAGVDKYAEQDQGGVATEVIVAKRVRIDAWLKRTSDVLSTGHAVLAASALAGLERSKAVHSKYVQPWMKHLGERICDLPERVCKRSLAQECEAHASAPQGLVHDAEPAGTEASTNSQVLTPTCSETQEMHEPEADIEADGSAGSQECYAAAATPSLDEMPAEAEINTQTDAASSAELTASNGEHSSLISSTDFTSIREGQAVFEEVSREVTPACLDAAPVDELATALARVEAVGEVNFPPQVAEASWDAEPAEAELYTQTDNATCGAELATSNGEQQFPISSGWAPMAERQAAPEEESGEVIPACLDADPLEGLPTGLASVDAVDEIDFHVKVAPASWDEIPGEPEIHTHTDVAAWGAEPTASNGKLSSPCSSASLASTTEGQAAPEEVSFEVMSDGVGSHDVAMCNVEHSQPAEHALSNGFATGLTGPWVPVSDPASNDVYYWNTQTNETTWTLP